MREHVVNLTQGAGAGLVISGVAAIYVPAGLIVAGLLIAVLGFLHDTGGHGEPE